MRSIFFQMVSAVRLTVLRAFGAISVVLLQIFVGRSLGESAAGLFYTSMMVVSIAATLACFGADVEIVRSVSILKEKRDWPSLARVLFRDVFLSFFLALFCIFIIILFAWGVGEKRFFILDSYVYLILPVSLCMVLAGALNGLSLNGMSVAAQQLIPYGVALLVLIALPSVNLSSVSYALIAGWSVSVFNSIYLIRKSLPGVLFFGGSHKTLSGFWSSRDAFIFQAFVQIYTWTGVAVISSSLSLSDAGVYGAAQRISIVISFLLSSYSLMNRPKFASLHAIGDIDGLQKLVSSATKVMGFVSICIFVVVFICSGPLMSLFGKGFERGAPVLVVLSFGQVVNAVLGSVGHVLNMIGRSKDMRNIMIFCVPMGLLVTWGGAHMYGLIGAAVGGAANMVVVNVLIVYFVRKRIGVVPLCFSP